MGRRSGGGVGVELILIDPPCISWRQYTLGLGDLAFEAPHGSGQLRAVFAQVFARVGLLGDDGDDVGEFRLGFGELAAQLGGHAGVDPVCAGLVAADDDGAAGHVGQEGGDRVLAHDVDAGLQDLVVRGTHHQIWQVNDNGGDGFPLAPSTNVGGGWLVEGIAPAGWTQGTPIPHVIGAMITTDVLVCEPEQEVAGTYAHLMYGRRGGREELISTARKAAWASLAFALRARAAVTVDVETRELDAGVRLVAATAGAGMFRPQLFLADSIENGAGFVTWLVEPARFAQLLADTRTLIGEWENPAEHACEGSCPSCLRDWSNTPFHPILDWRLAADLLDVLVDGQPASDRWAAIRDAAIRGVCDDFGWTVLDSGRRPVLDCGDGTRVCVVHPLEAVDAEIVGGVATAHGPALPFDVFNFDRRPGEVYRRR